MTLLLGAITNEAVVLAADGIEFRHTPNAPKQQDLLDRRKLYPLPGKPIALGIHGQNRLVPSGASLDQQRLAIDILPEIIAEVGNFTTVHDLCHAVFRRLTPDVLHTFDTLANVSISAAPMGILVIGFDNEGDRPRCFEAWWPLENTGTASGIAEHPENGRLPTVMHSGDGTKFAKAAISHGGRYNVDRLKKTFLKGTQEYVRRLYRKAESLQPQDAREFGGEYHEITITKATSRWSTPQ